MCHACRRSRRLTRPCSRCAADATVRRACVSAALARTVPEIREQVASAKYFTNFCLRFANAIVPRIMNALFKCKPLSTTGAEQLLLDLHSLKIVLLGLPSLGVSASSAAPSALAEPAAYARYIKKNMAKAEMILKVVLIDVDHPAAWVQSYINLVADSDIGTFQKVLEMKGLKRNEQQPLLEQFRQLLPPPPSGNTGGAADRPARSSTLAKLERLMNRH